MSEVRVESRFRVAHLHQGQGACLWIGESTRARRMWCYREHVPESAVGDEEFARQVVAQTPEQEARKILTTWVDPELLHWGQAGGTWRRSGLVCQAVRARGMPGMGVLGDFLRPVELLNAQSEWETAPRLQFDDCPQARRAAEQMRFDAVELTPLERCLWLACLSRPWRLGSEPDREAAREAAEDAWFAKEFPEQHAREQHKGRRRRGA